jgi:hypothetical protein
VTRNALKNIKNLESAGLTRDSSLAGSSSLARNSSLAQNSSLTRVSSTATVLDSSVSQSVSPSTLPESSASSSPDSNDVSIPFDNCVDLDEVNSDEEITKNRKAKRLDDNLFMQKNTNGELVHYCLLCNNPDEPLKSSTGDANLRKHLWHRHKNSDYLYPSQFKKLVKKQDQPITPARKKELDDAIINCIIQDSRTFNDFSKPGMKEFLNKVLPNYKPPHRTTIAKKMKTKYTQYRKMLIQVLSDVDNISITTDMWKNRNNFYYICLTGHFCDQYFNTISTVISFRRFNGQHNSEQIKKFILNEIKKLKITEKLEAITSDSGSEIKKACSQISDRFTCLAHNINLILKNGLKLWKTNKSNPVALVDEEDEQDEADSDVEINEDDPEYELADDDDDGEDNENSVHLDEDARMKKKIDQKKKLASLMSPIVSYQKSILVFQLAKSL